MRILVLNQFLFTAENGVVPQVKSIKDTMIYGMCLGFKSLGHEPTLVAGEEFRPTEREDYDFKVIFIRSNFKKFFPPTVLPYSLELKRFLKHHHQDFDMVLSSETFMFPSLFAATICPEKTVIWQELTCHQRKFHRLPSKLWHNIVAKLLMQDVRAVVVRSEPARRFIENYMPRVSQTIVDHGINIEKFVALREKNRQIISSSQLVWRKNIDGIIRKFARFHALNGYEDVKLIIAGRGEEECNLKALVSELKLNDFVEFVGFLSQKKLGEYVRQSMAFLVNTRRDLNMVSIPEAIVCGTPILTNLQPASAGYIDRNRLGIAKGNWDEKDIKAIIDNNVAYVDNCLAYRDNLTNTHSAGKLVEIFESDIFEKVRSERHCRCGFRNFRRGGA